MHFLPIIDLIAFVYDLTMTNIVSVTERGSGSGSGSLLLTQCLVVPCVSRGVENKRTEATTTLLNCLPEMFNVCAISIEYCTGTTLTIHGKCVLLE